MLIDGIDYYVLLMIDGADGEELGEFLFSDFDQANAFVRVNKELPKYAGCQVTYSLVEAIGENEGAAMGWSQEVPFEEFSEAEIRDAIETQRDWLRMAAEYAKMDAMPKSFSYRGDDEEYEQKKHRLKEFSYVCPYCFRELEDCRCKHYPYYLMQIDTLILPIVRELNAKGYKTNGCCAGHPTDDSYKGAGIYISFDQEYEFDEPIPEIARYEKIGHTLRIRFPETECNNLEDFQEKAIWALEDWAEMLPDLNEEGEAWLYD